MARATLAHMVVVIVGLGNPGAAYAKTRHNAGRMAVELVAKQNNFDGFLFKKSACALVTTGSIGGVKTMLVLPETMMNLSGRSVLTLVKSRKAAEKLVIIRDDLDMPLGTIKMTFGHGSGGHKGVESVMRAIKTKNFVQIKIGVSSSTAKGKLKKPSGDGKVIKYIIGKFSPKEIPPLKKALKKAATVVNLFLDKGIEKAMQEANTTWQ